MCYNAKYLLEKALKRAIYWNQQRDVDYYREKLREYEEQYQVSGFAHPKVIIYTNEQPYEPLLSSWGLIPHWTKSEKDALVIRNNTINARGETIFEKPSFRDAAKEKRCIIPVAGFYEHHHYKGQKYPFYITRKDDEPLNLAGLWSDWANKETGEIICSFSIVTTQANRLMSKIHNNPKLPEARMPLILADGAEDEWLKPINKNDLQSLLKPFSEQELKAHTVRKLSGKDSPGNTPEASEEYVYEELKF